MANVSVYRRLPTFFTLALGLCVTAAGAVASQSGTGTPLSPEKAASLITTYFGTWIPAARSAAIATGSVRYVSAGDFDAALRRNGLDPAGEVQTEAFVDRTSGSPVVFARQGATPWVALHELIHVYQNPAFRDFGRGLNEGVTHFHTGIAAFDPVSERDLFDISGSYEGEITAARALANLVGATALSAAFFGDGRAPVEALCQAVDGRLGKGALDHIADLLGRGATEKATPGRLAEIDQVLQRGYPLPADFSSSITASLMPPARTC